MVSTFDQEQCGYLLTSVQGVDAVNTSLEVLIFAGAMMLGQGWKTVLISFACMFLSATATSQPNVS